MRCVCALESRGGGKGPLIQEDVSGTLGCGNDQTIFQPMAFSIGCFYSEGMLSDNPKAGIYQAETARTLDCNGGNPALNQGGIVIVERKEKLPVAAPIVLATQQGGAEIAVDLSPTITQAAGTSGNNQPVVCLLNDQGGGTKNRKGRRVAHPTGGGPPARTGHCACAGFDGTMGAKARGIAYEEEVAPTLRAGSGGATVMIKAAYGIDCRNGDINQGVNGTIQAKSGGG